MKLLQWIAKKVGLDPAMEKCPECGKTYDAVKYTILCPHERLTYPPAANEIPPMPHKPEDLC